MKLLIIIALCALLSACGGEGRSPDRYILIMETTTHASEFVYVYDSEHDCVGAGSYRLSVYADKYVGYACKAV